MLLYGVLLSAWASGLSIHDGFSIHVCSRYWRMGQGGKLMIKTSRFFRFGFCGQPENRLKKVGFRSGKTEKDRRKKNDFRFSVHNPDCAPIEAFHYLLPATSLMNTVNLIRRQ